MLSTVAANAEARGSVGFEPASTFGVGTHPYAVALDDVNGDTNADIVAANQGSTSVTVLLGNGSGGFAPAAGSPFSVYGDPLSLAVDDLDGDTNPDIVTTSDGTASATVLLGDGTGGFAPTAGSPFYVGALPFGVATGDLNGDTKPDLVTANSGSNSASVLLGDGSGGFAPAAGSPFTTGPLFSFPYSVAIGDLNNDTKPDIVSSNYGTNNLTVLLGNGSGGFAPAANSPFAAGTGPISVAIAKVNGGTRPDLLSANADSNDVTVLLGGTPGSFNPASQSPFAVGTRPHSIAAGDLNGDTDLDLVTADYDSNSATVLVGRGSGRFDVNSANPIAAGSKPRSVAIADLNGDTRPDLVTANENSNNVSVLLNSGVLISGNRLTLRDNTDPDLKRLSVLSRDSGIRTGAHVSSTDPRLVGLTVRVESSSAGFDNTYTLPGSGWTAMPRNNGYRYKDSHQLFGPITAVLMRRGHLQITGKGSGLGHNIAADANPVNVAVAVGPDRFCMRFGGKTISRINSVFSAVRAPVSTACP